MFKKTLLAVFLFWLCCPRQTMALMEYVVFPMMPVLVALGVIWISAVLHSDKTTTR